MASLALAALAPLLASLPRVLGDPTGAPLLLVVACGTLGAIAAGRLARDTDSPLPPSLSRWALAFLAVAAASCVASIVRGETLYLLLRGSADPLYVNSLGMTAAERTRDAVVIFLGWAVLLAALDAFSVLTSDLFLRARLLTSASCGGFLAFLFAAAEPFLDTTDPGRQAWLSLQRRSGPFTDPNALGVGLGLLVPLLVAALFVRGPGRRVRTGAAAAGLLLAPFALQVSGSRTGLLLLACAGVLAAGGLVRARVLPRGLLTGAAFVAAAALLAALFLLPRGGPTASGSLASRLGAALSARSLEDLASHRTLFWGTAFEMIAEEPLSGVGLGGFPYEFPVRYEKHHEPLPVTDNATNALLDIGAECGLPALLLALATAVPLLTRALDSALSSKPLDAASRAAGATLAGLAVALMTGSHLRFLEVGLLAALVASFLIVPRTEDRAPRPRGDFTPPKRVRGVLIASGVLASFLALLVGPAAGIAPAFRTGRWAGVHSREKSSSPGSHRWMGARAFRRLEKGERSLTVRLLNARPDGRAVVVTTDVDGVAERRETIAAGETRSIVLGDLPPSAAVVRFRFEPVFVPRKLTGRPDDRELPVLLAWASGPDAS